MRFIAKQFVDLIVDLRQVSHRFSIALAQLPVQSRLANQAHQLLWDIALVAVRSIGSTEDISGEFWHVLVHQLTVSSNMTRFKRRVRSSVTNQVENTTKWSRKRSRLMVQYTDIMMFILFLSGKWCPHTDSNRGPTDYKSFAHKNSHHSSIGIPFANKSNQAISIHHSISLRYT